MNQIIRTPRGKQNRPAGTQSIARAARVAPLALWRTIERHRLTAKLIAPVVAAVACLGLPAGAASAAQASTSPHGGAAAWPTFRAEQPVPTSTDWAGLQERAARSGSVNVVVELNPGTPAATKGAQLAQFAQARGSLLSEFGGGARMRHLSAVPGSPIVAFTADSHDLARLRASKAVRSVTVNHVYGLAGTSPNGAQPGVQPPMAQQPWWDYYRIGADWANNNGYTGRGQAVVVIDTGVDRSHPWLSGHVTTEACFATNTNGTGACPNGSYYDYNTTASGVTGAAAYCTYSRECAHGTHVAQTAAGSYGVARGAWIVAIQASHPDPYPASSASVPLFNDSDLINALWYVYYKLPFRPAAINISVGGGGYTSACDTRNPTLTSYINALKNAGVATVIASGNNDYYNAVSWPGCISNAITVGNTTLDSAGNDAVLGNTSDGTGSNSSTLVDLLAPGTDFCSALPVSLDLYDGSQDGVGCNWYGTSMAAPHVTGAIAQIRQVHPAASVDQILSALQSQGTPVLDTRNNITRTRINVANAIYYGF
jgi:subtilisin family serine protease